MTTATDWEPGTWTDTGSHAVVTDVDIASAATDGAHTVDVHAMADTLARVQRRADMLAAENVELRRRLDGWEPRRDPSSITAATDLTERQQRAALVAPTTEDLAETDGEGMPLTPILATYEWPTWLGEIHHADAEWADIVARLHAMPEQYAAPPIERTVAEPVQVDYSYRQSEAWLYAEMVVGQSRPQSVYEQLAPERIQAGPDDYPPPEHDRQGQDPDLTPEHERRPEQSTADADRRAKVLAQAAHGERRELAAVELTEAEKVRVRTEVKAAFGRISAGEPPPAPEPEPEGTVRATWWARLTAWFGGATTRRRQTEQGGGA